MCVWMVFLGLGEEEFLIGQLFGFVFLVFGTLVYNEIIEVPIKLLNYNTKKNMMRRA